MFEKHLGKMKHKMEVAVIGLAIVVIVLGVCAFLQFTKPFAISEDGVKVEEPWVVKVGDNEAFVVASEKEGKAVIEGIKSSSVTENTKKEATTLSPKVTVVAKELKRGDESPTVVEADDAVTQVVAANKTAEPMITVTTSSFIQCATILRQGSTLQRSKTRRYYLLCGTCSHLYRKWQDRSCQYAEHRN